MTKPTLYVVTTDFDFDDLEHSLVWDDQNARRTPSEIIQRHKQRYGRIRTNDLLSSDHGYKIDGRALQRHLKKINVPLFPCLELLPKQVNLMLSSCFSFVGFGPDYQTVAQLVQLIDPENGQRITDRRMKGRSRLDLVVNYYSNESVHDGIIARLKEQFPVQELSICRKRFNVMDEGYTDEELKERYA